MSNLIIERVYGDEEFKKIFKPLIEEKINTIKNDIKEELKVRYTNNNYLSTQEKEGVDENE